MQKNKNIKLRPIDVIITILCITASILSGSAFWQEYNQTLTKLNETPVGTIVFKKRIAQRKFIDRNIWDILKQTSEIYNGDTIRTIEASEAVISFKNEETYISMNANTIIQIFYNDKEGARIDFAGGNLEVISGSSGVVITSGDSEIVIAGSVNLVKKEEGFSLSVTEGEAVFDGEKIESGDLLILDEHGERNELPAIVLTSFNTSARIISVPGEITPVVFSWNSFNFANDTKVIVETALDPSFTRIVQSAEAINTATATLYMETSGNYFWRAYPAGAGSGEPANPMYPSGTLEIIPFTQVNLITPAYPAINTGILGDTAITLSWTGTQGAAAYHLEISANADMSSPVIARHVEGTSLTQTGLAPGLWYWRVTPVLPSWVTGSLPASDVGVFEIASLAPSVQETAAARRQESLSYTDNITEHSIPNEQAIPEIIASTPGSRQPASPVQSASQPAPEGRALLFYNRGIQSHNRQDYDSAIENFTEAIRFYPDYAEAYARRGFAYLNRGRSNGNNREDINRAIEEFNQALRISPNNAWYISERGHSYLGLGELDRALSDFNESIRLDHNNPWTFSGRGSVYFQKGDYDRAISDYTEAIRLQPNEGEFYISRGNSYSQKGEHDRALADINQAIRINPNSVHFLVHRGNAYKNQGNINRAIEDYERAIQMNPNYSWAYECLGNAYGDLGWAGDRAAFDKAIENYSLSIRLNPNNPWITWVFNSRGWSYLAKGDYNNALSDFNEAIRRYPNNGNAYRGRGEAYLNLGNLDRAIEDIERGIRLDPDVWSYVNLGHAYYRKEDYDRAIEYFETAVRMAPDNNDIRNALEQARRRGE